MTHAKRLARIALRAASFGGVSLDKPLRAERVLLPGAVGGILFIVCAEALRAAGLLGAETAMLAVFATGLITLAGGIPAGFLALGILGAYATGSEALGAQAATALRLWIGALLTLALAAGLPAYLRYRGRRLERRDAAQSSRLEIFEAHFEALCAAVRHGVFLAEPGGTITHANPRLRAMLGRPETEEIAMDDLTETIHPDERLRVRDAWRRAFTSGGTFSSEHRVCLYRGRFRTVRVSAAPVLGPGGIVGYVGTVEDVSHLKAIEEKLADSQGRLAMITENVPAIVCYIDADIHLQFANRAFEVAYGRTRAETIGKPLSEILDAPDFAFVTGVLDRARGGETVNAERKVTRPDGREAYLRSAVVPHFNGAGELAGFVTVSMDVTSRREAEDDLFRERERALVTLNSISDAVVRADHAGRIEYLNPTAERLTGWSLEDAKGMAAEVVLAMNGRAGGAAPRHPLRAALESNFEGANVAQAAVLVSQTGAEVPVDLSVATVRGRGGSIAGAVAVFRDATAQRRLARRLAFQANHDPLTGLRNRRGFAEVLEGALPTGEHSLLYMDLDRFKAVNDSCGHAAGDTLLRDVAARLGYPLRASDTLARVGGDEFVALLAHCAPEHAAAVAEKMRAEIDNLRFAHDGATYRIGISIGIARVHAGSDETPETLLEAADRACYDAKAGGRNRVVVAFERRAA